MNWYQLNGQVVKLYPLLDALGIYRSPEAAWLVATILALAATVLVVFVVMLRLLRKAQRRAVAASVQVAPKKAKDGLAKNYQALSTHNSLLLAERAEIYHLISKVLACQIPSNHDAALALLREHETVFSLMVDVLEEGFPGYQPPPSTGPRSIAEYLAALVDKVASSSMNVHEHKERMKIYGHHSDMFKAEMKFYDEAAEKLLLENFGMTVNGVPANSP